MPVPTRRPWAGVALTAATLVSLTACGGAEEEAGGTASEGGGRTLTIATSNDAPFSFLDAETGDLMGIDGEMMLAMAEAEGWEVEVTTTDFATLIPTLEAGRADVIVDAMYITDEREEQIDFTDPWYSQGEGLVVREDETGIASRDDIAGRIAGAQTGTTFLDLVNTLGASEVLLFDSQATLLDAVENGQVDVAMTDVAVAAYTLSQNPDGGLKIVEPYEPYFPGTVGAGVSQDDPELTADLNAALADLKASPRYLEILESYGLGEPNALP